MPTWARYDMYARIRRASKNVTGNIGEACGRYHYLDSLRYYSIARGGLNETLLRLIDARALEYMKQTDFESLYNLIRKAEQTLNGYMTCVRRQRAGAQEYGDKKLREDAIEYEVEAIEEDTDTRWRIRESALRKKRENK